MSKKWAFATTLACAGMIVIAGGSLLLGGCDKLIECSSGSIPMRCHWAYVATAVIGVCGAFLAGCGFAVKSKEGRRMAAVAVLAFAVASLVVPSSLAIGICAGGMQCQQTILLVWGGAALSVLGGILQLAFANPHRDELPKMTL